MQRDTAGYRIRSSPEYPEPPFTHNRILPHGGPGPIGPTGTPAATREHRCVPSRCDTANGLVSQLHIRSAAAVVRGKAL
eukprot:SAG31_NODE_313_length_17858_cov_34.811307_9_plen_79_part_00